MIKTATDQELVAAYIDHVLEQTSARNARAANRHATAIVQIARELRRRGPEAQTQLVQLVQHPSLHVRSWAATHSLDFATEQAKTVLQSIANEPGMLGHVAQMTLALWSEGTLELP